MESTSIHQTQKINTYKNDHSAWTPTCYMYFPTYNTWCLCDRDHSSFKSNIPSHFPVSEPAEKNCLPWNMTSGRDKEKKKFQSKDFIIIVAEYFRVDWIFFFFFKNKDCFNINYLHKAYPTVDEISMTLMFFFTFSVDKEKLLHFRPLQFFRLTQIQMQHFLSWLA